MVFISPEHKAIAISGGKMAHTHTHTHTPNNQSINQSATASEPGFVCEPISNDFDEPLVTQKTRTPMI